MKGFTLIELIMVIVILGILAVTAAVKWPSGMREEAAAREFKRAVRHAQHQAMTRAFDENCVIKPWGIEVAGNRYTVKRQGADCSEGGGDANDPDRCAPADYRNRRPLDDTAAILGGGPVWFNGLGEPIASATCLKSATSTNFTITLDGGGTTLLVCPETGYVGNSCS